MYLRAPWNQHSVLAGLRITSLIPPTHHSLSPGLASVLPSLSTLCPSILAPPVPSSSLSSSTLLVLKRLDLAPTWTPPGALSPITRTTVRTGPTSPEPEVTPPEPEASMDRNYRPFTFSSNLAPSFRRLSSHPDRRLLPARPDPSLSHR